MIRGGWVALALTVAGGMAPTAGVAQEPARTAVTVDYVGVEGVYLPAGAADGLSQGDTLVAFAAEVGDEVLARLAVVSVSRRRSVVALLTGGRPLQRGTTLYLELDAAETGPPEVSTEARPAAVPAPASAPRPRAASSGPRISGRVGLDMDGRESRTSWDGDLFGETRRRYASSVARLGLRASGLPGDVIVRANVRAAHRYTEGATLIPTWSVRAYELSAAKRFEGALLDLQVGRFQNPYERFSAYWDGLLLRVGGRSFGVGVVGGLEPSRADEGFSTELPKATAFADVRLGRGAWRYASDVSWHWLRDDPSYRRTFLGWDQSVRVGPLAFDSDVRVDRPFDASARAIGRLRARGAVDVPGGLTVHATFARRRRGLPGDTASAEPDVREERGLGLSVRHRDGAASLDGGWMRWAEEDPGYYASASVSQRVGPVWLRGGGRFWKREDLRSLSLSPGASGRVGPVDITLSYRLYRTERATLASSTHSVDARGAFAILEGLRVTLGAQQQWGAHLSGTRLHLGFWRAF